MTDKLETILFLDGELESFQDPLKTEQTLELFCPVCDAPQEAYVKALSHDIFGRFVRTATIQITHQACDCPRVTILPLQEGMDGDR